MPFNSSQQAEQRLRAADKLTEQEVRDLFPYLNQLSTAGERRLTAELALQNLEAIQKFERSSGKLAKVLVWLTLALLVLTAVIAYYSVVLARAERRGDGQTINYAPPQD